MASYTQRSIVLGLALLGTTLAGSARAADKLTIMVGGIDKMIYLPAKLAEQLGYYKDEGLTVELLSEPAGVQAENELIAGAVQGAVGFYDHSLDLQAKGKIIESVVQFSQAPGEVELVSSKFADVIKSPADFKGRSLGVTGLGSSTNFLTQYLAVKNGVPADQITPVAVGAGDTFIAAMKQGAIQAGMTTEPTISRMLKTGDAKILIDMRTVAGTKAALGGTYPAAALYMQTTWVNAHRPETQKLANALVKTLRYIHDHKGVEIAEHVPADYFAKDKEGYIKALDDGKEMFTPDGKMPADGPETVLKVLMAFDKAVQGKTIDLAKTFTTEFVSAVK